MSYEPIPSLGNPLENIVKGAETMTQQNPQMANSFGGFSSVPNSTPVPKPAVVSSTPIRNTISDNSSALSNVTSNIASAPKTDGISLPSMNPQYQSLVGQLNNLLKNPSAGMAITPEMKSQIANIQGLDANAQALASQANTAYQNKDYATFNDLVSQMKDQQSTSQKSLTDLQSFLTPLREKYISSLSPGAEEQSLGTQLADIRKKEQDYQLSLQEGQQKEFGRGRPLAISTGRSQELARQAQFGATDLQNQESNILTRLGLAQSARQAQQSGYKSAMDFALQDYKTAQEAVDSQQTRETNLLNIGLKLDEAQRSFVSDTAKQFSHTDPDNLSPETQAQLAKIAAQKGVSYKYLHDVMQSSFDGNYLEDSLKKAQIARAYSDAGGGSDESVSDLAYAQQYSATGMIPVGMPKGSFGRVSALAKSLPKNIGEVFDTGTGVRPTKVGADKIEGLGALYDVNVKLRDARQLFQKLQQNAQTGLVQGVTSMVIPSETQQSYNNLRREIVDLIARARTGATLNEQEIAEYSSKLPSTFNQSLFLGKGGLTTLDSMLKSLGGTLSRKLSSEGTRMYGVDFGDDGSIILDGDRVMKNGKTYEFIGNHYEEING